MRYLEPEVAVSFYLFIYFILCYYLFIYTRQPMDP